MSSHPQGLRFSPFSSSVQSNGNIIKQNMQPQPQQQTNQNNKKLQTQFSNSLFSGSETDVTNSLENLSMEERYVLRHTARVAPQGQENLQENTPPGKLATFFLILSPRIPFPFQSFNVYPRSQLESKQTTGLFIKRIEVNELGRTYEEV